MSTPSLVMQPFMLVTNIAGKASDWFHTFSGGLSDDSYEGGCPANVPGSIGGGSASGLWLGLGSTVVAIVRCI
jgi:Fe2+ transport system protein B